MTTPTKAILGSVILSAACHRAPVTLVPAAERAQMEQALYAQIEARKNLSCVRPVLRGEPTPGRADEDLLAVVEPRSDSPLGACIAQLRKELPGGGPKDPGLHGQLSDAAIQACAALPDAIGKAVQHGDACSPWLAGRHAVGDLMDMLRLVKIVERQIEQRLDRHDGAAAMRLWFDTWRMLEDLHRGEVANLSVAMVAEGARWVATERLMQKLVDGDFIPANERAPLLREAEILDATVPPTSDTITFRENIMLTWIRQAKPAGWKPPWALDYGDEPPGPAEKPPPGVDPTDVPYLGWLAQDAIADRLVAACPPTANLVACRDGIDRAVAAARVDPSDAYARAAKVPPAEGKKLMVDALIGTSIDVFLKYPQRLWGERFFTRSLRLRAWILANREPDGGCASLQHIAQNAGPARLDPADDQPLDVTLEKNVYTIATSPKLDRKRFDEYTNPKIHAFRFACSPP